MTKAVFAAFGGAALLAIAGAAQAEPIGPDDSAQRYGYVAIKRADLGAAEARLIAQRAEEPNEPSVLINLAHVYTKTGRAAEAEALYQQVLAAENVRLALGNGQPAWSHDLAHRAIDRTRAMVSR